MSLSDQRDVLAVVKPRALDDGDPAHEVTVSAVGDPIRYLELACVCGWRQLEVSRVLAERIASRHLQDSGAIVNWVEASDKRILADRVRLETDAARLNARLRELEEVFDRYPVPAEHEPITSDGILATLLGALEDGCTFRTCEEEAAGVFAYARAIIGPTGVSLDTEGFCRRHTPSRTRLKQVRAIVAATGAVIPAALTAATIGKTVAEAETVDVALIQRPFDEVKADATRAWEANRGPASRPVSEFTVLNYVRHRMTAYDSILAALHRRPGTADALAVLRRRVYAAIAEAYPELEHACRVQLAQRGLFTLAS